MRVSDNPRLSIPLADYERHMETVGQAGALRRFFSEAYAAVRPERLAVLGCTSGADFDDVDPAVTQLALGVDINAGYVATAARRATRLGPNAQFLCADVLRVELPQAPFDLIHAALLVAYVDAAALFRRVRLWLGKRGVLSLVSQEPLAGIEAVTATAYTSLQILAGHMHLRSAREIAHIGAQAGFALRSQRSLERAGGKRLVHSLFEPVHTARVSAGGTNGKATAPRGVARRDPA